MWDFDEKAFDQFIVKKFNLKAGEPSKDSEIEKEEDVENLNEAALSEAITESLNADIVEEYRDIETYTYDYQMISSINISPSKHSIFSKKPKVIAKSDTASKDSKYSTKATNWSSGVAKDESNVKAGEMKVHLLSSSSNSNGKTVRSILERAASWVAPVTSSPKFPCWMHRYGGIGR